MKTLALFALSVLFCCLIASGHPDVAWASMLAAPAMFRGGGFRPTFNFDLSRIHQLIPQTVHPTMQHVVGAAHEADTLMAIARGTRPPPASAERFADIENEIRLNPHASLGRRFRVYLCGGTVAGGILTFTPQRDCIPFRLLNVAGLAGTYSGLQSGVEQYFAASSAVPSEVFVGADIDGVWLRPIYTRVGQTVTATVTGIATGQTALLCFDQSEKAIVSQPMGNLRPVGFSFTSGAGSTTNNITLQPQKRTRIRRVVIDSTVAGIGGTFVGPITVQNDPQFESSAQVPVDTFFQTALDMNIDGDVCEVGGQVVLTVTTPGVTTVRGAAWFDTE